MIITSHNNPRIAEIKKLWQNKYRQKLGRFIVEGFTFVEEAVSEGLAVEVVCSEAAAHKNRFEDIAVILERKNIPARVVSEKTFRSLSQEETPAGILAVVKKPALRSGKTPVIVALDRIQDPGNMGTILRTAENLGLKLVLAGQGCVDIYNPKVVRASAGAAWRITVQEDVDLVKELKRLKQDGCEILLTLPDDGQPLDKVDWPESSVIVLGNEAKGVDKGLLTLADKRICIPRQGKTGSLNVAAAAAIFIYEASKNIKS